MADPPSTPAPDGVWPSCTTISSRVRVTTVVEHTLAGLMAFADAEVVILTGEPYSGKGLTNVHHVPGLSYDSLDEQRSTPEELAEALHEFARAGLDGNCPKSGIVIIMPWVRTAHSLGRWVCWRRLDSDCFSICTTLLRMVGQRISGPPGLWSCLPGIAVGSLWHD